MKPDDPWADGDSQVVPNFQFMADARQSVPALCAEVERRGEAIKHMTRSLLEHEGCRCPKGDVLRDVAAILEGK